MFVSNFPYSTTSDDLHGLFSQFGEVKQATVVVEKDTKRPRGFGFVHFLRASDAEAAMRTLSNFEFQGRRLTVSLAEERRPSANTGPLAPEPERMVRRGGRRPVEHEG